MEPAFPINLGAALRLAANFGVPRVVLVRPLISPDASEVRQWACGAYAHLQIDQVQMLAQATEHAETVIGTASGRGRDSLPTLSPNEVVAAVAQRGHEGSVLVFGNETRGLSRADLDLCDMVLSIPTRNEFPVLNLTQAMAITLSYLYLQLDPQPPTAPEPAPHDDVEKLMGHLRRALLEIGFLDPVNPDRIIRKLRRLLGRAGPSSNEVSILHGICRQMLWAARREDRGDC